MKKFFISLSKCCVFSIISLFLLICCFSINTKVEASTVDAFDLDNHIAFKVNSKGYTIDFWENLVNDFGNYISNSVDFLDFLTYYINYGSNNDLFLRVAFNGNMQFAIQRNNSITYYYGNPIILIGTSSVYIDETIDFTYHQVEIDGNLVSFDKIYLPVSYETNFLRYVQLVIGDMIFNTTVDHFDMIFGSAYNPILLLFLDTYLKTDYISFRLENKDYTPENLGFNVYTWNYVTLLNTGSRVSFQFYNNEVHTDNTVFYANGEVDYLNGTRNIIPEYFYSGEVGLAEINLLLYYYRVLTNYQENKTTNESIMDLFISIINVPILYLQSIFSFELFGIQFYVIFFGFLALAILFFAVGKISSGGR